MDRKQFNDAQVAAIRQRVAGDFDRYSRWLRRLEKRYFPHDDAFRVAVQRVKETLAALDSVAKLSIGRKGCTMFIDRDSPRRG